MTPRERATPVAGHGHPGQRVPPARSLPRRRTARGRGGGLRRRPAGCPRRNPCWCDRPVRASIDAGLLDPPDPRWPGTAGVRLPNRDCHHRGGREPTRPGGRGGRGLPVRSVAHNPPAEGTGPPRLCQRCGSGVTVSLGGLVVGRIDGDRGAGRGGCPTGDYRKPGRGPVRLALSTGEPGGEPAEPRAGRAGAFRSEISRRDVQNRATAPTTGRARPGRRRKGTER